MGSNVDGRVGSGWFRLIPAKMSSSPADGAYWDSFHIGERQKQSFDSRLVGDVKEGRGGRYVERRFGGRNVAFSSLRFCFLRRLSRVST